MGETAIAATVGMAGAQVGGRGSVEAGRFGGRGFAAVGKKSTVWSSGIGRDVNGTSAGGGDGSQGRGIVIGDCDSLDGARGRPVNGGVGYGPAPTTETFAFMRAIMAAAAGDALPTIDGAGEEADMGVSGAPSLGLACLTTLTTFRTSFLPKRRYGIVNASFAETRRTGS